MAAREFTIDNVTFVINKEMTVEVDLENLGATVDGNVKNWPADYPNPSGPALKVISGEINPTAEITATADPEFESELNRWAAGYAQNVCATSRRGNYSNSQQTTLSAQYQSGPPIRDGEPLEFPFDINPDRPFFQNGELTEVSDEEGVDEPFFQVPLQFDDVYGSSGNLVSTAGVDNFKVWLALARRDGPTWNTPDVQPQDRPCIVLLGSCLWSASYNSGPDGEGGWTAPQAVNTETNIEFGEFYERQGVGVDGTTFPDLRRDATGNDELYMQLSPAAGGDLITRFMYNDDSEPIDYANRPPPPDDSNFLPADQVADSIRISANI